MACSLSNAIIAEAQRQGVPANIALAVAQQESGCNQGAIGAAGEVGAFQLMPATAAGLGVDPNSVSGNISGGIAFLRQLFAQFGNWPDALAAYNAGASRVTSGAVPSSTRGYVASVLAMAQEIGVALGLISPPDTSGDATGTSAYVAADGAGAVPGGVPLIDASSSSLALTALAVAAGGLALVWALRSARR